MSNLKPATYRVYLGEDDTALLKQICLKTELGREELLKKIAIAGIRALMANEMRVMLPLRFEIRDSALAEAQNYVLNDMTKKARAK